MTSPATLAQQRSELRRLINGYQVSQALYVVAALGIADRLGRQAVSSQDLAAAVGADQQALYRVLRALAAVGVLEELPSRRFKLTPVGDGLRSDAPRSLAGWAALVGRRYHWLALSRLLDGVKTGQSPFALEHGTDVWTYRGDRPEEIAVFNRAMNAASGLAIAGILENYDFSRFRTVADIGGGGGALIVAILERYPNLRGILFDEPHVVEDAREFIEASGVSGRCELVGGSFFEAVPVQADAYILKAILNSFDDDSARRVLRTVRKAVGAEAVLLVVERVIQPPNAGPDAKFDDLMMFALAGGRERTEQEFATLLEVSGYALRSIVETSGPVKVIEAVPT